MRATTTDSAGNSRRRRLGWFVFLWSASLAFWVLLAWGLRWMLGAPG